MLSRRIKRQTGLPRGGNINPLVISHPPKHIAIIMDGNGRWAQKRGLPKVAGHIQGTKTVRVMVEACTDIGVKALTLYTFSTENWKRPKEEVDALMDMLKDQIGRELSQLKKNNIRFNAIGELEGLHPDVCARIQDAIGQTSSNTGLILTLALNYGSRAEILNAVRNIALNVKSGKIDSENINEKLFDSYLYTANLPQVDLLIRTSGEMRLSNFLLWQLSYSEIYVTNKLWPDFTKDDLKTAIAEFTNRHRRFGG